MAAIQIYSVAIVHDLDWAVTAMSSASRLVGTGFASW